MNAYLNILGLETLGIRMKVLCQNALTLAKALEELAGITVNYPGLESSPYKPLVDEQFGGLGGAILTIRAGSREKAFKLINSLKYAHNQYRRFKNVSHSSIINDLSAQYQRRTGTRRGI